MDTSADNAIMGKAGNSNTVSGCTVYTGYGDHTAFQKYDAQFINVLIVR